jgi:hypothetical protein
VRLACNNGWLSQLEERASSILKLKPLLLGDSVGLDGEEQRVVAVWSYKTVLLLQMVRPKTSRPIPRERFRQLHELGRPPTDARVWLASSEGNNAIHETSTQINLARADKLVVPGFSTALALGRLLILCAGRLSPGPERVSIGSRVDSRITIEVWPASIRHRQWPPGLSSAQGPKAQSFVSLL